MVDMDRYKLGNCVGGNDVLGELWMGLVWGGLWDWLVLMFKQPRGGCGAVRTGVE